MAEQRGTFEKFVDSICYSESELCAGAMTLSFSKYLLWEAMNFLQHSTHFSRRRQNNKVSTRTFQTALEPSSQGGWGWRSM
jgi:hypothetical protein